MVLIDDLYRNTELPSFFYRSLSHGIIFTTAALSRGFLLAFNNLEVNGLPRFLDLLKSRADYMTRQKGLVTVSNHISVIDDPLIWGSLPLTFTMFYGVRNQRWSFGSHDLCFTNTLISHFFTLGQVLPTHRKMHSKHGGLFQPTFTEGVRMLSRIDAGMMAWNPHNRTLYPNAINPAYNSSKPDPERPKWPSSAIDPLSDQSPYAPAYPSYPNDVRAYNAPSRYACNSYSWIHIFPEGFIHQSDPSQRIMRYFKWGVSRLILEPPECPDLVPIFIEGTDQVMHESRTFPRFIPRAGKKVVVTYGAEVDVEAVFGDLRKRWRAICDRENIHKIPSAGSHSLRQTQSNKSQYGKEVASASPSPELSEEQRRRLKIALDNIYLAELGVVNDVLKHDPEVVELRKECTRRVREEVLKVRRSRGYPDEDPKGSLVETWAREGPKREGKMDDDTWVKEA